MDFIRRFIEQKISRATGAEVRFGKFSFSPLSGVVEVRDLAVGTFLTVRKIEAKIAIEAAIALAEGKKLPTNTTFNNGLINVPSYLLTPEAVIKSNINSTVIKDGFLTTQAIYGTSKS